LVRQTAIEAAAARQAPGAGKLVLSGLEDSDLQVRLAAIAGLALVAVPGADEKLKGLLNDRGDLIRAAAVRATIARGHDEVLERARQDPSWRVRQEVADALARRPDPRGAWLARQLLDDPSPAVEAAVVHSVSRWPLAQAGPILLEALDKSARTTREAAAGQLALVWPAADRFPVDSPPGQRKEALAQLQAAFRQEFGAEALALAQSANAMAQPRRVPPAQLAEAERLLDDLRQSLHSPQAAEESLRRLKAFGPALVPALEQITAETHVVLPEAIYRDVLPSFRPEFAALFKLRSPDVMVRRRGAEELAGITRQTPLGQLALTRLAEVAVKEPDSTVWRSVLAAIAADGSEPSVRLAYAAASHPASAVRTAACEYLAEHPGPGHHAVLLAALEDPHSGVARAAARALGAGGSLGDREPLKRLLGAADESLRVEAAKALTRLGDPAGPAALERLAYSRDKTIRRQVAVAMGQVPDPTFAATLVRLLDDQYSIRLAALDSLPKVVELPPAEASAAASLSTEDRVAYWKRTVRH